jgi:hypothetical protein
MVDSAWKRPHRKAQPRLRERRVQDPAWHHWQQKRGMIILERILEGFRLVEGG